MLNDDYRDMLQSLSVHEVRFLVVGAYALGAYGHPRGTGDIDIWVDTSADNARRLYASLGEFGAPLTDITASTFTEAGIIYQIGVAPRRIDIITRIDGVDFAKAYAARKVFEIDDLPIPFIAKDDLITNKRATGRERDRLDAERLSSNRDG